MISKVGRLAGAWLDRPWMQRINAALWALLLLSVPITSFPLIARWAGGAPVSPLAALPLLLLLLLFVLPHILRGGPIPRIALPLLVFLTVALIGALRAPFLGIAPWKGQTILGREVRAFITLGVGLGFYFTACLWPQGEGRLRRSLQWIYLGALPMLLWASVQIARLPYSFNPPPPRLNALHRLISIRDLFRDRVTGMAYEPSWLADQLLLLYLPLLLASVLRDQTVFPLRWRRLTVESVLLAWSAVVLFFTFSRVGYIAFGLMVGVVILANMGSLARRLAARLAPAHLSRQRWVRRAGLFLGVLTLVVGAVGILLLAAWFSPRLRDQLTTNYLEIIQQTRFPVVYNVANHLEYAERLLYWVSAFLVFSRYPLLGIGLGNAGFLFPQVMPAFGTHLPEILYLLSPNTLTFANPKSLWLRLLAETGILGFSAFAL